MIGKVLNLIRLPLLLVVIWTIARFLIGFKVPYEPRGNAMFSILGLCIISSIYFGAISGRINGIGWVGAILVGVFIGFFAEVLIFIATFISYSAHLNTYFVHWDSLNLDKGTDALRDLPMSAALAKRAGGLIGGSVVCTISALIGRVLSGLAPKLQ